ncbi:helix-turn-helix domain-containing protein [Clostridium tetani]|uniref:helix-turn-helix domain-containing protein n=2 Tax=Clostridium tetani TaxID=1513 RepID=UPI0029553F76|nr:helix-turn-helix transcriptional regulator [Clostridium tetani]
MINYGNNCKVTMMTKTEKLKHIILSKYNSIREFARIAEIPSTTLTSALDKDIGGMAVDRFIKICEILNVDIKTLEPLEQNHDNLFKEEITKSKTTNENMKEIINRIKTRRNELMLSYQDLADKTGLSKSTLQRYETGAIKNMPLDKLDVLAKALNVSPAYLMGWEKSVSGNDKEDTKKTTLLSNFNKLNDIGKDKVITYTKDLLGNNKYSIEKDYLLPIVMHTKDWEK